MIFKRKAYQKLLEWKEKYSDRYSLLVEGARRVGKSTLVEHFAKNEYRSYILIDFSNASDAVTDCFNDIDNLEIFYIRLQAETGTTLYEHESLIIFDEVQFFPKARQATKHLVKDGRYSYISTGSLISIKKNVKDILIPSEEMKLQIYPMDYEEFLWATDNGDYDIIRKLYLQKKPVGQLINRKLMRDFRIYMAVGGMPQAVEAFTNKNNFEEIDRVKREIIALYEADFKKIDTSGSVGAIYRAIPAQLSKNIRRYVISAAIGRKSNRDNVFLYNIVDSKTVLISYNTTDPRVSLSLTKDLNSFKLYAADTGLFVTLMFIDRPIVENDIYKKMLADKLPANLGYLYENAAAQCIAATNHELYYHTWEKKNSTHYYEIDFMYSKGTKVLPIEVKSSGVGKHESLKSFCVKYSKAAEGAYVVSQKDYKAEDGIEYYPIYMLPALLMGE